MRHPAMMSIDTEAYEEVRAAVDDVDVFDPEE